MEQADETDLSSLLNKLVTNEDNFELCKEPSEEEIKDVIFSILQQSSLGPDGFGSSFFIICWDCIKDDVVEATREFFSGIALPRYYALSYIVLIPKVPDPKSFDKFRPISLCFVAYKIFSKIIVSGLSGLLPRLISFEQGVVIPRRSIFENISLAQEMVHSINKRVQGGNVRVKIDMAKAYDRVHWEFLLAVLESFGFSWQFCKLIEDCVKSPFALLVYFDGRGSCLVF